MSKISYEQCINEYLPKGKVLQLATMSQNGPWICTLHYASSQDGTIYWFTKKGSRHSIDIDSNAGCAVAIVFDIDKKVGMQMTGISSRVSDEDSEKAHTTYSLKFGEKPGRLAQTRDISPHTPAYYMFTPAFIKVHDEAMFPTEPQQIVDIIS